MHYDFITYAHLIKILIKIKIYILKNKLDVFVSAVIFGWHRMELCFRIRNEGFCLFVFSVVHEHILNVFFQW